MNRLSIILAGCAALFLSVIAADHSVAQDVRYSVKDDSNKIDACVDALQRAYEPGRIMPNGDCECSGEPGRWQCKVPLRDSPNFDADQFFGIKRYTADTQAQACQIVKERANNNWQKLSGDCICGPSFSRTTCYVYAVPKAYSGPRSQGAVQE